MATKDKRHTLHVKEEDVPMAEEKPQDPQGPASGGSEAPPKTEPVPSIEEALASLGATSVAQGGYDGGHAFGLWFADFMKKKEAEKKK